MFGNIGELHAEITAGLSQYRGALLEAQNLARGASQNINKALVLNLSVLGVASIAGAAVALTGLAKQGFELVDSLDKMSQKMGRSIQETATLKAIAETNGTTLEELASTIDSVTLKLSRGGDEGSKVAQAFQYLGVSIRDNNGNLKDSKQIIIEASQAYENYGKTADARLALETALGSSSTNLLAATTALNEEQKRKAELESLGYTVTDKVVEASRRYDSVMDDLKWNLEGVTVRVAEELLPAMSDLVQSFLDSYQNGGLVRDAFDLIDDAAHATASTIEWFGEHSAEMFGPLIDAIRQTKQEFADLRRGIDVMASVGEAIWKGGQGSISDQAGQIYNKKLADRAAEARQKGFNGAFSDLSSGLDTWESRNTSHPHFSPHKKAGGGGKGGSSKSSGKSIGDLLFDIDQTKAQGELSFLKEHLGQVESIYKDYYDKELISADAYYTAKRNIAEEELLTERKIKESELSNIQADLAKEPDAKKKLELQNKEAKVINEIVLLEEKRRNVGLDSARELAKANDDLTKKYEEQAAAIKEALDPTLRNKKSIEEAKKLHEKGFLSDSEFSDYTTLNSPAQTFADGWKKAFLEYQINAKSAASLGETAFNSFTTNSANALAEFATTGKLDFAKLAQSIIADLIRIQIQESMVKIFGSMFGMGVGAEQAAAPVIEGAFTSLFASGGIVDKHSVTKFASGGVVFNSPATIPMAQIAEAGHAEAMIPAPLLKLMAPVGRNNGSTYAPTNHIVINLPNATDPDKTAQKVQEALIRSLAKQEINNAYRVGGQRNPVAIGR